MRIQVTELKLVRLVFYKLRLDLGQKIPLEEDEETDWDPR